MTSPPRYSIGIDLGTTNCALGFVPLHDDNARSEILLVPQRDSLLTITESPTLPSFLYLPEPAAAAQLQNSGGVAGEWVVGQLAKKKTAELPGRVVHSAKSWLCHHTADRSARFLPWGSDEIGRDQSISPIAASAMLLGHLRDAWNRRVAASDTDFEFDRQEITITVPASFDAAAQRLTLQAAAEAGFPDSVRLLEEPQAAFYCWLEGRDAGKDLWSRLPDQAGLRHILVVDIGGGTSDFSLFELSAGVRDHAPEMKRVAVSDHILLGGDNLDLAIAHTIEPRLSSDRAKLSGPQWQDLVARCRELKEKALSSEGPPDEVFSVSLPGRGGSLIADLRSAQVTRAELQRILLDGFFPECGAEARPYRTQAGLREWGLPFAADSAITRHLADFLRDRPRVDAVLFNGGSLQPLLVRQRICQQIAGWQDGRSPLILENAEFGVAVARGAARFGKILFRNFERIEAGAPHAVFLEVHRNIPGEAAPGSLVCILPRGTPPGQQVEIVGHPLQLRTNRPVRFQAYYSARDENSQAGDIATWTDQDFRPLPALETTINVAGGSPAGPASVPVVLTAGINELGLLQISCLSVGTNPQHAWPLEFNLRPAEQDDRGLTGSDAASGTPVQSAPNAAASALEAARRRIELQFTRRIKPQDKFTAARLMKDLEQVLGMPRYEWNGALVRALWPSLESCMDRRRTSADHEEAWLTLAGFLLRPGFGAAADDIRINSLWRLREVGLCFPGKRIRTQEHILWRRVAGGLTRERQESILAPEFDRICRGSVPPEFVLLTGSLERLSLETKTELIRRFIPIARDLANGGGHSAPYLIALGLLLNRAPSYAGPEAVVPAALVERAYKAFRSLDWADPKLSEMRTLFLRAARVVGNRSFDLPGSLRSEIAIKLEKSGVAPARTAKLSEFMPLGRSERMSLYGEALPPGLILAE